jgi:hypothetical protein
VYHDHVWLQYGKFKESNAKTDDHCHDLKHFIDLKNNQAAGPQGGSFPRKKDPVTLFRWLADFKKYPCS